MTAASRPSPVHASSDHRRRTDRPAPPESAADSLAGEQHLRDFLKHAGYLIQSTDLTGRLLFVNEAWGRTLGIAPAQIGAGLSMEDVLAPESRAAWADAFGRVLAGESVTPLELTLLASDGRRAVVSGESNARLDPVTGRPIATRAIFRDVTAQRAAESEARLAAARHAATLAVLEEGVVFLGADATIIDVNPSVERILGVRAGDVVGRRLLDWPWRIVDAGGAPLAREEHPALVALRTGAPQTDVVIGVRRANDGRRVWVSVSARPLARAGEARAYAVVTSFRDVTGQMEVERRKSEFVSTVSHEIRTPLTSIRGSLALIEAGPAGQLPEQVAGLVRIAHANTQRLIRLVNDVLDLEKIEAGKEQYAMAPVAPAELVRVAIEGLRGVAEPRGIQLVADVAATPDVFGDRDRLLQVLTNLVGNALKFSSERTTVVVSVRPADGGTVRVAVENSGAGIRPDQIGRLFQKFEQLDRSDSRQAGGTGLGLAITKSIVEAHGGRVGVESEPGARTVFWCDLPSVRAPARLGTGTVLLVEDERMVRTVIRRTLERHGYSVLEAQHGADALLVFERNPGAIDLVVTDVMMPELDGRALVARLRAIRPGLRVLFISGYGGEADPTRGLADAGEDLVEKPVDLDVLVARVRALLALEVAGD